MRALPFLLLLCFQKIAVEAIYCALTADDLQFPYLVSFHDELGQRSFCMGAIVGSQFAVSAAHCFVDPRTGELIPGPDRTIRAQVGAPDIRVSRIGVEVLRVYIPAEYRKSDGGMAGIYDRADIAVVRLARSVVKLPDSCALKISPLPRSHVLGEGDTSLVAGYGCSRHEDPRKLKYTMMKPIDDETCGVKYLLGEDDSVFCAAVTAANAGSAVCQGDEGTPYVHKSGVVGILSYVPSDRSSDAIFTKVGAYEQFIKRAMTEKIDHTIKVVDYRS